VALFSGGALRICWRRKMNATWDVRKFAHSRAIGLLTSTWLRRL